MIRTILSTVFCLVAVFVEAKESRPNIVWLVSEDNSAEWLKLYSEDGVAMPNVERLAKGGLVFEEAFSCAPVCSVARSTIISAVTHLVWVRSIIGGRSLCRCLMD